MADRVGKRTFSERLEVRLDVESKRQLSWLSTRLHRSGNAIVREAISRMHAAEERVMLTQAGVWREDGSTPQPTRR